MAGFTKISDPSAVVGGRWRGMPNVWKATALASTLIMGGSIEALAQDPPGPQADKVWGGCLLSGATVTELIADLEAAGGIASGQAEVSFVVVYTLTNNNNGQPLGSNFTGPVICTDPDAVDITAFDKNGESGGVRLKETTDIPAQTGPAGATSVDIKSAEEVFVLQYQLNDGANDGDTENRVCHTTDANVDCFRIFGLPVIP